MSGFLFSPLLFSQKDTIDVTYEITDTLNRKIRLFDSDEILEFTLSFDITSFKRKKSDKEYLDAILTYHISYKDSISKHVKIKSRGEMRRTYCDFPPIKLNFKKSDSSDEFSNIDKLKVVTHCKGNEEYILEEYLIYKLYNALTDNSLKVRLARINYINTVKPGKPITKFAFLIEPIDVMCKRTGSVVVSLPTLTQKNIKPDVMDRMAIFNYMIGNTDWSLPIRHNVLVLSQGNSDDPNLGVVVPFDFDYSGLINTDYAVPFDGLGLESVRERRYLGICRSVEVFIQDLKEFDDKKAEFYRIINELEYLNDRSKKDMINYLEGFFRNISRKNNIAYNFLHECLSF